MSSIRKILEEIKWGISPEVLAKKHSWEELSSQDPEELLNFARNQRDSQQAYNLLVYLFRISRDKDVWFSVEVLSQALQHPAMSSVDCNNILRTMRNRLDRIKDEVTARQPAVEKIRKYWLLEASYYAIYGATLAETNRIDEAVQNYQIAEGIFQQLGLNQQAENYSHKIEHLTAAETKSMVVPEQLAEKPSDQSPPSGSPPLTASFQDTLELMTVAQLLPATESVPTHKSPPTVNEPVIPVPDNQYTAQEITIPEEFNPSSVLSATIEEPAEEAVVLEVASEPPAIHSETPRAASEPVIDDELSPNQEKDLPETIVLDGLAVEDEIPPETISFGSNQTQESGATPTEISAGLSENHAELQRLANEIQEQVEILAEIQLDIHLVQDRRSLLFREVQNLEKKAAYLKDLCERLEQKSKK